MFKFLRKKLKDTVSKISGEIDKKAEESEEIIEKKVKRSFFSRFKRKVQEKTEEDSSKESKEVIQPEKVEEKEHKEKKAVKEEIKTEKKPVEEPEKVDSFQKLHHVTTPVRVGDKEYEEELPEEIPKKKAFFTKIKEKIITKKISENQFTDLFWDLEVALMENNVAVEVIGKIKEDLKDSIVEKPIIRSKVEETIMGTLKSSIEDLLKIEQFDFLEKVKEKKPFVICFIGINGSGKTTTIAKIAKLLEKNNLSCVLAASDTFRAASIEQLQKHADNLKVKLIKHNYGSDPAAVAYDAIEHAKSKNIDVVLIDTAGRVHSNANLTEEMKKIIRVAKPDLKIFVGESITGNDCVEQAKKFNEAISIDAIILSKADIDEKGGAALSVSYVTKKPIIFIGTGQEYEDIKKFEPDMVINNLGLA